MKCPWQPRGTWPSRRPLSPNVSFLRKGSRPRPFAPPTPGPGPGTGHLHVSPVARPRSQHSKQSWARAWRLSLSSGALCFTSLTEQASRALCCQALRQSPSQRSAARLWCRHGDSVEEMRTRPPTPRFGSHELRQVGGWGAPEVRAISPGHPGGRGSRANMPAGRYYGHIYTGRYKPKLTHHSRNRAQSPVPPGSESCFCDQRAGHTPHRKGRHDARLVGSQGDR